MFEEELYFEEETGAQTELQQDIQRFCESRNRFLELTGLHEKLTKRVKRMSENLLDVLQIFTELTPSDIDLINREISVKNSAATAVETYQCIPYEVITVANETWQEMHNLVEKIFYYFERKKLFKKLASFYSPNKNYLSYYEREIKSIFSEYIYTILMRLDGNSSACVSYIFLWLKTASKRELLTAGLGQVKPSSVVSFDEIDEENEKARSLHETIGYEVDFDSYIQSDENVISTSKAIEDMREKIFYQLGFYNRKSKIQQKEEVTHV